MGLRSLRVASLAMLLSIRRPPTRRATRADLPTRGRYAGCARFESLLVAEEFFGAEQRFEGNASRCIKLSGPLLTIDYREHELDVRSSLLKRLDRLHCGLARR